MRYKNKDQNRIKSFGDNFWEGNSLRRMHSYSLREGMLHYMFKIFPSYLL